MLGCTCVEKARDDGERESDVVVDAVAAVELSCATAMSDVQVNALSSSFLHAQQHTHSSLRSNDRRRKRGVRARVSASVCVSSRE